MVDYLIILAFVAYSVYVGFSQRRQAEKSTTEYFLAGRQLSGWQAGTSMAATQFAADTPLLVAGLIAVGGIYSFWRLWIYGLAFLLMGFVLGRSWRRAGVLTDAELTRVRYSGKGQEPLRMFKAVYYGTVINCAVLAFVLIAATRIFEVFLPWHEWLPEQFYASLAGLVGQTGWVITSGVTGLTDLTATTNNVISMLALVAFTMAYANSGGLRSVVRTDLLQFVLMIGGSLALSWLAVRSAGGWSDMLATIRSHYGPQISERMLSLVPPASEALLPFLVIISLQWFFQMSSDGTGYLAQRTMGCSSDREARTAGVVFSFLQVVLRSLIWLPGMLALLVLYPFDPMQMGGDAFVQARETTFVQGIDDLLPIGLRGLMITALLAALASTIDSHLNWGGSYWTNDLYQGLWLHRIKKREAHPGELVRVARISNVIIIAIAFTIMLNLGSIQKAWQISLLFGAGTGAVLILRWLWERINVWAELAAIGISIIGAPIVISLIDDDWMRLATMSGLSTVTVVLTALLTPGTDPARLEEFYKQVRPPGWWGATAARLGEPRTGPLMLLWRDGRAMLTCAVSLYGLLIGVTKLMLDGLTVTSVFALAAALVAMPFWWPTLSRPHDDGSSEDPDQ